MFIYLFFQNEGENDSRSVLNQNMIDADVENDLTAVDQQLIQVFSNLQN